MDTIKGLLIVYYNAGEAVADINHIGELFRPNVPEDVKVVVIPIRPPELNRVEYIKF